MILHYKNCSSLQRTFALKITDRSCHRRIRSPVPRRAPAAAAFGPAAAAAGPCEL